MIENALKVFILEDLENDIKLVKRQVLKVAPQAIFTVAKGKQEFETKINWATPDVVLSDYNLPDFNGLRALLHVKEKMSHVPFVFITGTLNNEEKVAEAILKGASGYILKDNLREIPERLPEILSENQARLTLAERQRQSERRKSLVLQKIQHLLKEAEAFQGKTEIESALEEVLQ
ncbi:MAG: response regulator [Saprospiraceae bacterium]